MAGLPSHDGIAGPLEGIVKLGLSGGQVGGGCRSASAPDVAEPYGDLAEHAWGLGSAWSGSRRPAQLVASWRVR
jgi:hypothetical protein